MGFLNSTVDHRNPGLDPALAALQGAQNDLAGMRTGSKVFRAMNRGDFTNFGNPFLAQQAANNRLAASHLDPTLPPELAQRLQRQSEAQNAENAGVNFENYARGLYENAFNQKQENRRFKFGTQADLAKAIADANLQGNTREQKQGWGGLLMQGIGAAGGLLSGIGAL